MLIRRSALEVVRLCLKPDDDVAPVATHVFIDDLSRVTATDGVCAVRVKGLVEEEPNLFMRTAPGIDDFAAHALPGELVDDFLKAWSGDQVIVREDRGASLVETLDGQTSRRFESKVATLDPPKFDAVLRRPRNPRTILVSVEKLLEIVRTLKATGASAVKLSIGEADDKPVYFTAKIDTVERIEGALMPMRDYDDDGLKQTSIEPPPSAPTTTPAAVKPKKVAGKKR